MEALRKTIGEEHPKALAADAKTLRDGATTTVASELEHVPVVSERSRRPQ